MATFSSQKEAEEILGDFMNHIATDPDLRPKFVAAATSFRANYADPDVVVSMVTTQDPPVIKIGDQARAESVDVDMFMTSDDGHKFWLGELNIPMAMARKKIKIEGSVQTLLKLLPAMQPAFGMYPAYLDQRGFTPADA